MRSAESTTKTTFYVYFMNQLADQLLFFCVFVVLSPENILFSVRSLSPCLSLAVPPLLSPSGNRHTDERERTALRYAHNAKNRIQSFSLPQVVIALNLFKHEPIEIKFVANRSPSGRRHRRCRRYTDLTIQAKILTHQMRLRRMGLPIE